GSSGSGTRRSSTPARTSTSTASATRMGTMSGFWSTRRPNAWAPLLGLLLAGVAHADSIAIPGRSAPVYLSSCGTIDGLVSPLYLGSAGTCIDVAEGNVAAPVQASTTFANLSCALSGTTGTRTVTIIGRRGACGGALTDAVFTCTMGPGTSTCS